MGDDTQKLHLWSSLPNLLAVQPKVSPQQLCIAFYTLREGPCDTSSFYELAELCKLPQLPGVSVPPPGESASTLRNIDNSLPHSLYPLPPSSLLHNPWRGLYRYRSVSSHLWLSFELPCHNKDSCSQRLKTYKVSAVSANRQFSFTTKADSNSHLWV